MTKCQYRILGTGLECSSQFAENIIHVRDPTGVHTQDFPLCQLHSDAVLKTLFIGDTEISDDTTTTWEEKKEKRQKLRWDTCRRCLHLLSIKDYTGQPYDEVWTLIAFSSKNRFRSGFHLHRDCCLELMQRFGYYITGSKDQPTIESVIKKQVQ